MHPRNTGSNPAEQRGGPSNSLERALLILELVEQAQFGLTNSEISRRLTIATSTCSYILGRLEKRGYLERGGNGRYRMGLSALALAYGTLRDLGIRSTSESALYRLVNETGLSASIGMLERGRILVVDRIESPKLAKVTPADSAQVRPRRLREVGRELPLHSNAMGKAVLAYLPAPQTLAILDAQGLPRCTPHTITSKTEFLRELEKIREQGFATTCQEQYVGVCGIGVPIYDEAGLVRGAVSLNGSLLESRCEDRDRFAVEVQIAARTISSQGKPWNPELSFR